MTLLDEPAWRGKIDVGRSAGTDAVAGPRRVAIHGDIALYGPSQPCGLR